METLYVALSLAPVLLTFAFFALRRNSDGQKKLPPGSMGWPIIGESIEFLFGNPETFVFKRMNKYSPDIFKTKILGEKTAVICGPDGNKFLFNNEQTYFTAFRPRPMQRMFRLYAKPGDETARPSREEEMKMRQTPGFLKPEALVRYLGFMDAITQQQMRELWEGKKEVKAYPLTKTLTLTLACRFFLGTEEPERIARLVDNFDDVTVGMHSLIIDFPGTIFHRATKAANVIRKELRAVIQEKKCALASGKPMQDILTHMIVATDASGKHMPEAEVADKMMGFLTAGYSTVATAMTFFMKYVGERPAIYEKILNEQKLVSDAKNPGEPLNWDDINKMKYSWNAINEVMRLTPPLLGTFREALTDFTYAGYTVPKGWKVYWTVTTTSKNPEYFPNPEKFDPSRYDSSNILPPYTFVPFGGGPRMCPGKEYARLSILTFVHNVMKRFKWELVFPNEKITGDMMPAPEKGLPIRLHPH